MSSLKNKLLIVQSELKAPKGQWNDFGKYKYRSAEDVVEAVKPLLFLNDCLLLLTDDLVLIGDRYYIKASATLYDTETEETLGTVAFAREELSKKGMDGSQITGAASSYARKYALNGLLGIDDNKDADRSHPIEPENATKAATKAKPTVNKTYQEEVLKAFMGLKTTEELETYLDKKVKEWSEKDRDKLVVLYQQLQKDREKGEEENDEKE